MSQAPVPAAYSAAPVAGGFPAFGGAPFGGPGQFYKTVQNGDTIVDQYVVPGETMHVPEPIQVPGVTTVMENQVYMEPKQVTVKVPRTIMEDVEVTYQVPAMESRVHQGQRPRTVMEEQVITVQEPRTVMEPVAVQVPQVQTVQAIQMHHKIVEYERPRIVGGRMLRTYAGPTQTVGTAVAPTTYTVPQATTYTVPQVTSASVPVQASPAPVATFTQPFAYGSIPTYGAMPAYGFPSVGYPAAAGYATAAPANNKFPAPADDAISA